MLSRDALCAHADHWIACWNARNLDGILAPFAPDACFISPLATTLTGRATISGVEALRAYWEEALRQAPLLHFRLVGTVCDEERQTLVVIYEVDRPDGTTRAVEIMTFRDGRQITGEALYGARQPCAG